MHPVTKKSQVSMMKMQKLGPLQKQIREKYKDDKEKLNYLKSSLSHEEVERWLNEYEKTHQKYFNPEFINFLHEHDSEAEIIEVSDISY